MSSQETNLNYLYASAAILLAYLLGSLSFAVIVSRCMGLKDPRSYGSNNPGATNVLRSGNKLAAVATLLLDGLKGWLPVVLVKWFGHDYGLDEGTVAAVGLAAFIGHLYPVFFQFKGGKGVATAAGVLFGVDWLLGLATLATWVIIASFHAIHRWRRWRRLFLRRCITCLVTGLPGMLTSPYCWRFSPSVPCWCTATGTTSPSCSRVPSQGWVAPKKL